MSSIKINTEVNTSTNFALCNVCKSAELFRCFVYMFILFQIEQRFVKYFTSKFSEVHIHFILKRWQP